MNKMKPEMAKIINEMYQLPFNKIQPSIQAIKKLLNEGHDVDAQNEKGDTLLHVALNCFALRGGNTIQAGLPNERETVLDVLYLTTKHHPNPFIKNNDNLTPSMLAAQTRLTNEWQMLSSYERAYQAEKQDLQAKETGKALLGMLYFMANQYYEKTSGYTEISPDGIREENVAGVEMVYDATKKLGAIKGENSKSVSSTIDKTSNADEKVIKYICKHVDIERLNGKLFKMFGRQKW